MQSAIHTLRCRFSHLTFRLLPPVKLSPRFCRAQLPYETGEEQLAAFFGQFGAVADAAVLRKNDGSGQSKGCGFVIYATPVRVHARPPHVVSDRGLLQSGASARNCTLAIRWLAQPWWSYPPVRTCHGSHACILQLAARRASTRRATSSSLLAIWLVSNSCEPADDSHLVVVQDAAEVAIEAANMKLRLPGSNHAKSLIVHYAGVGR
jgi:RNA recognition motif. (a.k.a. RRM, RBD, or RNP domain)